MRESSLNAVFMGSKSLGLSVFRQLIESSQKHGVNWHIVHPRDQFDTRSNLSEWHELARQNGIDLTITNKKSDLTEIVKALNPSFAFVCGWYSLIANEILEAVPKGVWGIHNSLLPKYRGHSPLVWSIINGEPYVGSTCFKISSGIDDGPILFQVRIENSLEDDISTLTQKIEKSLIKELSEKFDDFVSGTLETRLQDNKVSSFCSKREPADGRIDWNKTALQLHNFIRAQTFPYPGAFFVSEDKVIRVLKSRIFPNSCFGVPGQVISSKDSLLIACGSGSAIEVLLVGIDEMTLNPVEYFKSNRYRFS